MAKADLKVIKHPGPTVTFKVDDRTTSSQTAAYEPGEPLKKSGNFVIALATGDPEIATDEMVGIARKKSTETSTADGEVEVISLIPGLTQLRGKATTAASIDTAAELLGVIGDCVTFDLTGSGTNGDGNVFTIDEDEGDNPNVHGLKIITGNTVRGTLDVLVNVLATMAGTIVGQTMD